jgi:exodeoxyribonuclease V
MQWRRQARSPNFCYAPRVPTLPILTPDQAVARDAILRWLREKSAPFLTLGGYAGTGKTTLIAALRQNLAEEKDWGNKTVAFCSYTGKAASVLRRKLQELETLKTGDSCSTIHSLIYRPQLDPEGTVLGWGLAPTLAFNLIIVDEGSMLNQTIWRDLLGFRVPILVVGDHGQLPPIEGSFNLLDKPELRLETIVRQAAGNPIIELSARIRAGEQLPFGRLGEGVRRLATDDPDLFEAVDVVLGDTSGDSLCLCGRNRTRVRLNQRARQLLERETAAPEAGDRLICLRNNHAKAVYNGMIGTLQSVRTKGTHWLEGEVLFEELGAPYSGAFNVHQFLREKTLTQDEIRSLTIDDPDTKADLFDYGYALTVHKAQGSEARRVVVVAERMQAYDDLMWRRWLYTAVTRAREEVVLIG